MKLQRRSLFKGLLGAATLAHSAPKPPEVPPALPQPAGIVLKAGDRLEVVKISEMHRTTPAVGTVLNIVVNVNGDAQSTADAMVQAWRAKGVNI